MPRNSTTRKSTKRKPRVREEKVMRVMAKRIKSGDILLYPKSKFQSVARELEVEKVLVCKDMRGMPAQHVTVIVRKSAAGLHTGMHMGLPHTRHLIRRPV